MVVLFLPLPFTALSFSVPFSSNSTRHTLSRPTYHDVLDPNLMNLRHVSWGRLAWPKSPGDRQTDRQSGNKSTPLGPRTCPRNIHGLPVSLFHNALLTSACKTKQRTVSEAETGVRSRKCKYLAQGLRAAAASSDPKELNPRKRRRGRQ